MRRWIVITPAYPPTPGGVSDYTRTLACELGARGDQVYIWAPRPPGTPATDPGVTFHALPDHFRAGSRRALDEALSTSDRETVLLVQYVPHGFGLRGMNLPFAYWLSRRRQRLWLMVHEAIYPFLRGQPLAHHALAAVTRGMLAAATSGAERVFVSTPAWHQYLRHYGRAARAAEWLPIPATIPSATDAERVSAIRRELALSPGQPLVGHFGTYHPLIADPLRETVNILRGRHPDWKWLMLGRNAAAFIETLGNGRPTANVFARDDLKHDDVSNHLRALDVVLLPFPDGINSRRTTAMAALTVGSALVTTTGANTEPLWHESGAVALAPCNPLELATTTETLVRDGERCELLRSRGGELYEARFAVHRVVDQLRSAL